MEIVSVGVLVLPFYLFFFLFWGWVGFFRFFLGVLVWQRNRQEFG